MATLEVHDGLGRVRRVTVSRDQTFLFGSSPKCDLVLDDPAVLPFHGRLRWSHNRFKVDPSPDAEYLEINGHKMATSSFRQGDEISVGSCRIFMINADDEPADRRRRPQDDRTVVQPPPFVPANEPRPKSDATIVQPPPLKRRGRGSRFESDAWLEDLETGAESRADGVEILEPSSPVTKPSGEKNRGTRRPDRDAGGWGGLIRALRNRDAPPGQERILSSPLVVGLAISLVVLVLLSMSLWGIIQRTVASRLYNQGVDALNDGDYRNAIRYFDQFLARKTGDARAGKARVLVALANVRQFTTPPGASWSNALEAEKAMVKVVSGESSYRDSSTELAELVLKTAEGLADRARGQADAKTLAEAESAVALHGKVAGKPAAGFLSRSHVPGKLAEARSAVRKAAIRGRALAKMDAALKAGSSADVYSARDALIAEYADLAEDRGLVERMTRANDLIRRAVTVDGSRRPAESEPRADRLGPPATLVVRSSPRGATPSSAVGPLVFALAEGLAFGLDGSNGDPLWQVPVGLTSPFPPQPIAGGSGVLAFDARHDELIFLEARTGRLLWRQSVGEPVSDPPLVLGNQVLQTTPGGKLLLIDLVRGELQATVDLGMRLSRPPVTDEAGQFLYIVADHDCLFIVSRDPLACVGVEYLGHAPGSVACPPARLGRFLIVAENHNIRDSRWHVFVIDPDRTKLRPVQRVPVSGWTWSAPVASGPVLWANGDRGSAAAYAIGTYDAKAPFRLIAQTNPEPNASGPAYAIARSERELWVASGRSSRLELDAEEGRVRPIWTLGEAGPAVSPPQVAGNRLVLTQQSTEGAGVALWGIDPGPGTVQWRTIVGAGWRVTPVPDASGEALTTLGDDGRPLSIGRERIESGGFVEVTIPRAADGRIPAGPVRRLEAGGLTVLVPGPFADHFLVLPGASSNDLRRVALPSPIGAMPATWGQDLFLPGVDGRADLVDPGTGEPKAEPFVAPYDRSQPTRSRAPVRLSDDSMALAEQSGRVLRIRRTEGPFPRLVASSEANLGAEIAADPLATDDALLFVTGDGRIRALSARDLTPIGAWPVDGGLALPPALVGGCGFFADRSGKVHAFGADGQRLWSITLRDGPPAVPPAVIGDSAWFLSRRGTLQRHAMADGAPLDRIELDILPAGELQALGSRLVVPAGLGTYRTLRDEP